MTAIFCHDSRWNILIWKIETCRMSKMNHDCVSIIVALRKLVNEPWRLWTKDVSQHFGYEAVWNQTNLDMNQVGSNQRVDNPGNFPFCRKFCLAWNHVGLKPRQTNLVLKFLHKYFSETNFASFSLHVLGMDMLLSFRRICFWLSFSVKRTIQMFCWETHHAC